jgi:hypothetical protein
MIYKRARSEFDSNITINYTDNGFYLSNQKGIIGAPCELIKDPEVIKLVMKEGQDLMDTRSKGII